MSTERSGTSELAAKKGILAGGILTVVEVTGGLVSGSLGLLSSAFNTLADFVAAVIMLFAVRESSKPPDEVHMYGHEKIESAAAIGEILLLFAVCSWIVYTAFSRLMSGGHDIDLFWIAFGTNFVSIVVDMFAYLNLRGSSKKYKSEAIEAGALHFLNDLLIAVVVIVGLVFYLFGVWYADSIAALCIVGYIVYSGLNVVRDSFGALMDAAPKGVLNQVKEQILRVDGVEDCHHLRVRRAGSKFFVDAHVEIDGQIPLNQAHSIASSIEEQIVKVFPDSDILIHTEPHTGEDPIAVIRNVASQISEIKGIHGIAVKTIGRKLSVSCHLELEPEISVKSAHEIANCLEERLNKELKNVSTIVSHLEPTTELSESSYRPKPSSRLQKRITQISRSLSEVRSLHEVQILTRGGRYSVTLHCTVDSSLTLVQAHKVATKIEEKIKMADEKIDQVIVHCEPEELAG
ncbi:cation-efflux pump [Candidatus Bathyarchaeota archaeon]|nr:cation-efflux pump [Candidatus Bathyarchaeota archaeon]